MEWIIIAGGIWALIFGTFSLWVAIQKNRPGGEGFILGALFGPVGVLVEALLPTHKARQVLASSVSNRGSSDSHADIDTLGRRAYAVEIIRLRLDELAPDWEGLPYSSKRTLLMEAAGGVKKTLLGTGMTPTEFRHAVAEARGKLL